jgi:AAA domain, putative AbiEii toxin, Type IV TA system
MLESFGLKNFRSCVDVTVRVGEPVVALVGKNGVGKTNVLHGLRSVADLCAGEGDPLFSLHPRDPSQPAEFTLDFTIRQARYAYRTRRTPPPAQQGLFEETLSLDGAELFTRTGERLVLRTSGAVSELRFGVRASSLPTLLQVLPADDPLAKQLKPASEYLRALRYYPLMQDFQEHVPEASPFIEAKQYENWKALLGQGRPPRSVLMRLLHMYLADKPQLEELKLLLGPQGLDLIADIRIEDIVRVKRPDRADIVESAYAVSFMPGSDLAGAGRWFRHSGISAGTWRIVQMLTYLIFDQSSCMLLEQPEDCIHTGLLLKVIDVLRSYSGRTQLICTTHSARVMNIVGPKGIRFVTATNGETTISQLSNKQLAAAATYLAEEGTLADFVDTL